MGWWIAAALVWLGAGLITALVVGLLARSPLPELHARIDGLERVNRELRRELLLARTAHRDRRAAS
jgi:hypothetical protein